VRGREWLGGIKDDLAARLAALAACPTATAPVWAELPRLLALSTPRVRQAAQVEVELQQRNDGQSEPVTALPAVTTPVLAAAVLPADMPASIPAMVPLPEPEPAPSLVVGSRAEVVFGRSEHIALVRVRRRARRPQGYGEPPRRRMPVSERDIPPLVDGEAGGEDEQCQQVMVPSLWDLLVAPTSEAIAATPKLLAVPSHIRSAPSQSQLWERETAHTRS